MHFDDYPDETLVDHAVAMKTAMDHYRAILSGRLRRDHAPMPRPRGHHAA